MTTEWKPIEQADIKPFDAERWYETASPRYLLMREGSKWWTTGEFGYTKQGKGRWKDSNYRNFEPTHFAEVTLP